MKNILKNKLLEEKGEILIYENALTKGKFQIHQSSYIDENVSIGENTRIWHFTHIMKNAIIGKNCSIGQNVNIGSRAKIGDNVKIQNNVSVYDDVILENDVFCGPSMVFTNVINPRAFIERKDQYKKTIVKKGAAIGANATIVCGVTLGRYCFIGAGAVVNRDVKDYALVVGVPAKQIGWVCKCGVTLKEIKDEKKYKIIKSQILSGLRNEMIDDNTNELEINKIKIYRCKECNNTYYELNNNLYPVNEK